MNFYAMNQGQKTNNGVPRRSFGNTTARRVVILAVLAALAVFVLAGCSDDENTNITQIPFPDPDPTNDILSIWGTGDDDVFMVGHPGLVLHYDGTDWELTELDAGYLTCVWGTANNNVYICGHDGKIFHYDGTSWSSMDSGTDEDLYDIGEGPYGDLYIVGNESILKRLTGGQWTSTQRRAYRYNIDGDPEDTLTFHLDIETLTTVNGYAIGGNASIVLMENDIEGYDHEWLWGVFEDEDFGNITSSFNSATVEDNYMVTNTSKVLRLTDTLDGLKWRALRNAQNVPYLPSTYPDDLTDVWLDQDADLLYLTTRNGDISTMNQDGTAAQTVLDTSGFMSAIWGSGGTDIYASGHGAGVYHFDGNNWETVDVPLPETTAKAAPSTDKFGRPLP